MPEPAEPADLEPDPAGLPDPADLRVETTDDPVAALEACRVFLERDPVVHNVALTVLRGRVEVPIPGRYWWVVAQGEIAGYAWRSPALLPANVVPTSTAGAHALAERMHVDIPDAIGVVGEAAAAAAFTGRWTELTGTGAHPHEGERIYRLDPVDLIDLVVPSDVADAADRRPGITGAPGLATADHLDTIVPWLVDFHVETGDILPPDLDAIVARAVDDGRMWLWFDGDRPVALTRLTDPVAGVARIGPVYTPPDRRGHGYATSLVAFVSGRALDDGATACMLFTQLANAGSNAIYRRIGYRSVGELIAYRFTP